MINTASIPRNKFIKFLLRGMNNKTTDMYEHINNFYTKFNIAPNDSVIKQYIDDFLTIINKEEVLAPVIQKMKQRKKRRKIKKLFINKLNGFVKYAKEYHGTTKDIKNKIYNITSRLGIKPQRRYLKFAGIAALLIALLFPASSGGLKTVPPQFDMNKKPTPIKLSLDQIAAYKNKQELKQDHFLIEVPSPSTLKLMKYDTNTGQCYVEKEIQIAYGAKETPSPITDGVDGAVKISANDDLVKPTLLDAENVEARISGKGDFSFLYKSGPNKGKAKPWGGDIPWFKMKCFYITVWYEVNGKRRRVKKKWIIHPSATDSMYYKLNNRDQSLGCFRANTDDIYKLYKEVEIPEEGLPLIINYNRFKFDNQTFTAYEDSYDLETEEQSLQKAMGLIHKTSPLAHYIDKGKLKKVIKQADGTPVSIESLIKDEAANLFDLEPTISRNQIIKTYDDYEKKQKVELELKAVA